MAMLWFQVFTRCKSGVLVDTDDILDQACTTCSPRAACGPRMHFVWPAKAFQSRSTNEVCLPSVFRVLCVIESTLNKSFPSIVT